MSDRGDGPEKIGKVLEGYLQSSGLQRPVGEQEILLDWERLVGEGIAKVTRAKSIRDGVLVVEVKSSAWMMELNLMKRQIMAKVNAIHADTRIEKLVFVLAEHG